jgi:hypothetical protein
MLSRILDRMRIQLADADRSWTRDNPRWYESFIVRRAA